jgi:glucose/arabinose dehydrogenase
MEDNMRPQLHRSLRAARAAAWITSIGLALAACGGGGGSAGGGGGGDDLTLEPAFGGIDFDAPVKLVQHPVNDDRWYVVEQGGKIFTFLASDPLNTLEEVLDLAVDQDINLGSGEQGLLGLAFEPGFNNGGELYLAYTDEDADDSILARYTSPDVDGPFVPTADPIVLSIPHDADNHNGGDIMFGADTYLYYSMGDAAIAALAQDTGSLLGKVLRIDVQGAPAGGEKYNVPSTNPFQTSPSRPFCDGGATGQPCPEVYAYGLRNPWRMNFDPDTDALWLGDVGQSAREEIDLIVSGGNYGWPCREGDLEGPGGCMAPGAIEPEAAHVRDDAAAITGGVVYRGTLIPDLEGWYVYGDYVEQNFFAFDIADDMSPPTELDLDSKNVAAFGQGRDGEIYAVTHDSPSIYRIVPEL